jgi:hypothetical protein
MPYIAIYEYEPYTVAADDRIFRIRQFRPHKFVFFLYEYGISTVTVYRIQIIRVKMSGVDNNANVSVLVDEVD